jgi:excisionase family DNA binding protein
MLVKGLRSDGRFGGLRVLALQQRRRHVGFLSVQFKRHLEVEPLMNVDEACDVLGCKKSKLYELVEKGYLEFVKLGGSRRFRPAAIRECIDRHVDRRAKRAR